MSGLAVQAGRICADILPHEPRLPIAFPPPPLSPFPKATNNTRPGRTCPPGVLAISTSAL